MTLARACGFAKFGFRSLKTVLYHLGLVLKVSLNRLENSLKPWTPAKNPKCRLRDHGFSENLGFGRNSLDLDGIEGCRSRWVGIRWLVGLSQLSDEPIALFLSISSPVQVSTVRKRF